MSELRKIHCPECGLLVHVVGDRTICPGCKYEATLPPEVLMERVGAPRLFQDLLQDVPDDPEAYYNERAEQMP